MYFEIFPTTYFSLDNKRTIQTVRNIFLRAKISEYLKTNLSIYDEYDIADGETPEILSDRIYNSSQYHWVILHMNDIIDPRFDWPLSVNNLTKYCEGKYANIYATHHYENTGGYWVNANEPGAVPISNFQYEESLNESKRRIKLLKPQYLESVVSEFKRRFEDINV